MSDERNKAVRACRWWWNRSESADYGEVERATYKTCADDIAHMFGISEAEYQKPEEGPRIQPMRPTIAAMELAIKVLGRRMVEVGEDRRGPMGRDTETVDALREVIAWMDLVRMMWLDKEEKRG